MIHSKVNWMYRPEPIANVPMSLENLHVLDEIFLERAYYILESVKVFEADRKYIFRTAEFEQVYYAFEENWWFQECFCASRREFTIIIVDQARQGLMRIRRPFKCCGSDFLMANCSENCCAHQITVECPVGTVAGHVREM